jgi:hypothetical protein
VNLSTILANEEYLRQRGAVKVGDPVTWDGGTSRGTVVQRKGRRVVIQIQDWRGGVGYRNGYRIERNETAVHKLGKGPGE